MLKNNLKETRKRHRVTQEKLAEHIGCNPENVRRIERGGSTNLAVAITISKFFGLEVGDIWPHRDN